MNYLLMAYCFLIHFIADFLLQSRDMAKNKSSNFTYLAVHAQILFVVFTIALFPFLGIEALWFSLLNSIIHGIIDWHIWRVYKWIKRKENINTFKYWEDSMFYSFIGFDQFLHGATLVGLLCLLK